MLELAIIFFILAIVAGAFGFGRIAGVSTTFARGFFFLFIVLVIIAIVTHLLGMPRPF
jgi:uncharacterized membrane protein YtjA (UPF0391 family)